MAVFIKHGRAPIVVPLDSEAGGSGSSSRKKEAALNSARYIKIVEGAIAKPPSLVGSKVMRRRGVSSAGVRLLHDRSRVHTSKAFTKWAAEQGIDVLLLPTKGADLDPLDYSVFGTAKKKWLKAVQGGSMGWEEGRQLFIDLLEGSNPSKAIEQLAERMQWCIQKEGWPFESFMKKQKCDK